MATAAPEIPLTPRQHQLLSYIQERRPACPSAREMRSALGYHGGANITIILAGLEERGFIRRTPRRARSIEVLREAPHIRIVRLTIAQGIAYARAWRLRNKPYFDSLYGAEG